MAKAWRQYSIWSTEASLGFSTSGQSSGRLTAPSPEIEIADFDSDGTLDLAVFEGISSGLLDDDDLSQAASLIEPGKVVALLVWENTWAAPFVSAMRRGGADVIASGRIPVSDVIDMLDALEVEAAEETASAEEAEASATT